jgi:outer membrane protein TolC
MKFFLSIILAITFKTFVFGQQRMSFEQYMDIVTDHHPMTRTARLQKDYANANKMIAWGAFDPKFSASFDAKNFDGKSYYNLLSTGVKVPTWYGIELKAFYDQNTGSFLNEESSLPSNGLFTLGISFPLAQGFVIDERRFQLKNADIFTKGTDQDRRTLLNDLIYDASIAYLQWQEAYAALAVAKEGLEFANIRLQGTKGAFVGGDKPAIDTLEVYIVKLTRESELISSQQTLENAKLQLNNFLWVDGLLPLEVQDDLAPDQLKPNNLAALADSIMMEGNWLDRHPNIRLAVLKIDQFELEQKLNREMLKPDVRLNINPLVTASNRYLPTGFSSNDFKYGVSAYYPILTRKERGKVRFTQTKINEGNNDLSQKRLSLKIKFDQYINNISLVGSQLDLISQNVNNYRRMLQSENQLFEAGESSVFLVNSREVKFLESRLKEIETISKLIKNRIELIYITAIKAQ